MNYNKYKFTKEQFLALPLVDAEQLKSAPVNTPILVTIKDKSQVESLMDYIENIGVEAFNKGLEDPDKKIKVDFWIKFPDGNVQSRGGHLIA